MPNQQTAHERAVPLTDETFAEVWPPEEFADVLFQRCPDAGCDRLTMTLYAPRQTTYVFHLPSP